MTTNLVVGRTPPSTNVMHSTDNGFEFAINPVLEGRQLNHLENLMDQPNIQQFVNQFRGYTGRSLIEHMMTKMPFEPAWGADVNYNDLIRKQVIGLGRIMVGGTMTELQTKNYAGLGLLSSMLIPSTIPEKEATFKIDIVYNQMTMAMPNALRTIAADISAQKTSMKFGLAQYLTGISFLHKELMYLTKRELLHNHVRLKFGQLGNRFRLSIIHSHAIACMRQPSFIEMLLSKTAGKQLLRAGSVAHHLAKFDAILFGIANRNADAVTMIVEMAITAMTGQSALSSVFNGDYVACMNSKSFVSTMVSHSCVVDGGMDVFRYSTQAALEDSVKHEILTVDWSEAVLNRKPHASVSSVSNGYTAELKEYASGPKGESVTMPALVLNGGMVVPIIQFDGSAICQYGPSMGSPFISRGQQWRWCTIGAVTPLIYDLYPTTVFSSDNSTIKPQALGIYSPRVTSVVDHVHGQVTSINLHKLHQQVEKEELYDLGGATRRFAALRGDLLSNERLKKYLEEECVDIYHMPGKEKLSHTNVAFEYSPRFMVGYARVTGNMTAAPKPRHMMWNGTAMSHPRIEDVSVAAELYNCLALDDPKLTEALAFVKRCGSYSPGCVSDVLMIKSLFSTTAALQFVVSNTTRDTVQAALATSIQQGVAPTVLANYNTNAFHSRTPVPTPVYTLNEATLFEHRAHLTRCLKRIARGNGHPLLTDPFGWSIFREIISVINDRPDVRSPFGETWSKEQMMIFDRVCEQLIYLESKLFSWMNGMEFPPVGYLDFGQDSNNQMVHFMCTRWSWIAAGLFDTCIGYTQIEGVAGTNPANSSHLTSGFGLLPTGFLAVLGNQSSGTQSIEFTAATGERVSLEYVNNVVTHLFQTQYDVNHWEHATTALARARARNVRQSLASYPAIATALCLHYSLLITAENVKKFDKDYYSSWSYCMIRRMIFEGYGLAILPCKTHLFVVGNTSFDMVDYWGRDQFYIGSVMRYAVVPMGVHAQGIYFPHFYVREVSGMELSPINAMIGSQDRNQFTSRPGQAGTDAIISDWAPGVCPPLQTCMTDVSPVITISGRMIPDANIRTTMVDYFKSDEHNPYGQLTTCPFHNLMLNETQTHIFELLMALKDPSAKLYSSTAMNYSNTALRKYMQYLNASNLEGHLESVLQKKLNTCKSGVYRDISHGFDQQNALLYVDASAIGANSEFMLNSGSSVDNINTLGLVGRTVNFTFNPYTTRASTTELFNELQGMNLTRHLNFDSPMAKVMPGQMLQHVPVAV